MSPLSNAQSDASTIANAVPATPDVVATYPPPEPLSSSASSDFAQRGVKKATPISSSVSSDTRYSEAEVNKKLSSLFNFAPGEVQINAIYKGKKIIGTVSAAGMAMASPVWRKFLYPPWNGQQSVGNQGHSSTHDVRRPALCATPKSLLQFGDDDGDALLVLLRIVHLRFNKIPVGPLPYVCKIATLCDQYDCVELVRPWMTSSCWLKDYFVSGQKHTAYMEMLFIAWVFGMRSRFDEIGIEMVKNLWTAAGGTQCLTPAGLPVKDDLLPSVGTLARILSLRLSTISKLVKILYDQIQKYLDSKIPLCVHKDQGCHAWTLGSLIENAKRLSLWPKKDAKDICISVLLLAKRIQDIRVDWYHPRGQAQCGMDFTDAVAKVLAAVPSPTGVVEGRHMEAQKKKFDAE